MTLAILTTATIGTLNLIGLLLSFWLDRSGIPEGLSGQAALRKRLSLSGRLPLILANLAVLLGGAFIGLTLVADTSFTFAAPSLLEVVLHIGLLMVVDDLWFYWVHRGMHENKWMYKKIHKLHHKAYAPVPIEYLYVHPVEWMVGAIGPVLLIVAFILVQGQMNAWTFLAWGAIRTLHELDIHSGVRSVLGPRLPLFAPTEHHDLHHAKPNKGNYASTFLAWDKLMGTEVPR